MLKKLFGSEDHPENGTPENAAAYQRLLAELAIGDPAAEWIALVNANGMPVATFPAFDDTNTHRISAMSVAMASLGERIADELKNGALHYTIIAGEDEITVMMVLSFKYLLTSGIKDSVSIEKYLSRVQNMSAKLLHALNVQEPLQLPGIFEE